MQINKGDTIKIVDSREGVVDVVKECSDGGLRIWFEGDEANRYYRTEVSPDPQVEPDKSVGAPFTRSIEIIKRAPQWQEGDVVIHRTHGARRRDAWGIWRDSDGTSCSNDSDIEPDDYIVVIKMGKLV